MRARTTDVNDVFAAGKSALPRHIRLQYIEELAVKEGLDPVQARWQFEVAMPHLERIHARVQDNRETWLEFLRQYCMRDRRHGSGW